MRIFFGVFFFKPSINPYQSRLPSPGGSGPQVERLVSGFDNDAVETQVQKPVFSALAQRRKRGLSFEGWVSYMVLPWFYLVLLGFIIVYYHVLPQKRVSYMVLPWFYHGFTMVLP